MDLLESEKISPVRSNDPFDMIVQQNALLGQILLELRKNVPLQRAMVDISPISQGIAVGGQAKIIFKNTGRVVKSLFTVICSSSPSGDNAAIGINNPVQIESTHAQADGLILVPNQTLILPNLEIENLYIANLSGSTHVMDINSAPTLNHENVTVYAWTLPEAGVL